MKFSPPCVQAAVTRSLSCMVLLACGLVAQTPAEIIDRQNYAASVAGLPPPPAVLNPLTVNGVIEALDLDPAVVGGVTFCGLPQQRAVTTGLGVLKPMIGDTMLVLSTGVAGGGTGPYGLARPEPGSDMGGGGQNGCIDAACVRITLTVPAGLTKMGFTYRFLTAEYPDFIATPMFGDTFMATIIRPTGSTMIPLVNGGPFRADTGPLQPAYDGNAKGTGFDLYAPDPSGLTLSFPGGLPDCGISPWMTAMAAVTPGETLILELKICDVGDAIFDSEVLVDDVHFFSLDVVDANDPLFRNGNRVTNDPNRLATGGTPRIGIAADGVSRLLLRANASAPGTVTFTIATPGAVAGVDGGLDPPGGTAGGLTLTVPTVLTAQGHQAFAIYRSPIDFVRSLAPSYVGAGSRPLVIQADFAPGGGGGVLTDTSNLTIVRPPVILAHGLWSSPAVWASFNPLVTDPRFRISYLDYSGTNAASMFANAQVANLEIRRTLNALRAAGIACTQVDWVAHSFGGLVARTHQSRGRYYRFDNFGAGDFHKLVTICSPHWGSPLANLLITIGGYSFGVGAAFDTAMTLIGMPISFGAVDDLQEGSFALARIAPTAMPSHTIVGKGGSDLLGTGGGIFGAFRAASGALPPPLSRLFMTIAPFTVFPLPLATVYTIFRGQTHDTIVLTSSQEGGAPPGATTLFGLGSPFGGNPIKSIHTEMPSYVPVSLRAIQLLNTSVSSPLFSVLPVPNLSPPVLAPPWPPGQGLPLEGEVQLASPGTGIAILSPASGTVVTPGQVVSVTAGGVGGFMPQDVFLLYPDESALDLSSPPYTGSFTVPVDAAGALNLVAIANDGSGTLAVSPPAILTVQIPATLLGLAATTPDLFMTDPLGTASLSVTGAYSDGVTRNVSSAAAGTTWVSSNPAVATVSPNGTVQAFGQGLAVVTAQNGTKQATVLVEVAFTPVEPYGDGLAGTGGFEPVLDTGGQIPNAGNAAFQIVGSSIVGGASGVAAASTFPDSSPLGAGTLLISIPDIVQTVPVMANGAPGAPGAGSFTIPAAMPANPALIGLTFYLQAAFVDAGSVFGISLTNGLRITIVP